MVPKIASRFRSTRDHLRHLAIVFKVEIRLKIVSELYIRAMSPKDFYEEFGGGSVERVSQHFEVLEEHGWLRFVGHKERRPGRRGRPEKMYRATEVAFFDTKMWELLPYSLRLACSWNLFKATAKELREGMKGASLEGRASRDLSCTQFEFDYIGWKRVLARLAAHFESIFEEREDAKIRIVRPGEDLVRVGILQIGFELPRSDAPFLALPEGSTEPPIPFPERLAPIFADDLSLEILATLNERESSVMQFHRELAADVSEWAVRYRFQRLRGLGWITVVDKVRRRGAYEQIFRATKPAILNKEPWTDAPKALEKTESWQAFARLSDWVKKSITDGIFDVRPERHVTWSVVHLDREGWNNVVAGLDRLEAFIREEEKQARKRIEAGEKPLTMVVGLGAFESPSGRVKAP